MDLAFRAPADAAFLAEATLVLFDLLSLVLLCTIFYFVFVGGAVRIGERRKESSRLKIYGLAIVAGALLAIVNKIASDGRVNLATWAFAGGFVAFAAYYFAAFRPLVDPSDYRVRNTAVLWAALAAFTLSCLVFLIYTGDRVALEKPFVVTWDLLAKVAGIVVSALGIGFAYVMKAADGQRDQRRRLYQTLELQSIALFRFESDHPDLVAALWYGRSQPPENVDPDAFGYLVRQYTCQMLNLFEMAVRFRAQEILPNDAFGSWLIWIWELCQAPRFQAYWLDPDDLPSNYTRDFRDIVSKAVECARMTDETWDRRRHLFFQHVADAMNCREVETWFDQRSERALRRIAPGKV